MVIGRYGTGKTSFCREYVRAHPGETGYVLHCASLGDRRYKELVIGSVVEDDIDSDTILQHIHTIQKKRPTYVIIDDCFWEPCVFRGVAFVQLIEFCAEYGITLLITMKYAMWLSDDIRARVSAVVVLREGISSNIQRIHEAYTQWYLGLEELTQALGGFRDALIERNETYCLIFTEAGMIKRVINTAA